MMASSLKQYATPIAATEVDRITQVAETISTSLPVLEFLRSAGGRDRAIHLWRKRYPGRSRRTL